MTRLEEFAVKLARVRELLASQQLDGVLLSSWANFAWLTCGGDDHIVQGSEAGVARLIVTPQAVFCVTDILEARRIQQEELRDLPIELHFCPWEEEGGQERLISELCLGRLAVAEELGIPFARLRWSLLEPEIERYRQVGRLASLTLSETAQQIEPGMTEHEIAALLAGKMQAAGASPNLVLVATDERIPSFRHPIPTDKPLDRHALLVVGCKRWGLVISATRLVHFGPLPGDLADRHRACCMVDACFNLLTRPGAKEEIFARALETYARLGYADEWKLLHQGGPTGYAGRDYRGTLGCPGVVKPNQAFAWNPSITGTKSEDTIIAGAEGPEFLSAPLNWPLIEVQYEGVTLQRADILIR